MGELLNMAVICFMFTSFSIDKKKYCITTFIKVAYVRLVKAYFLYYSRQFIFVFIKPLINFF